MKRDPRIDAYIAGKAEFARPILERLRAQVHGACPDCEETLKWSSPAFLYKGNILAQMAAFKAHASFGFWQGSKVTGENAKEREAMGSFGRLASLDDLPDGATMTALVRRAMTLIDAGEKTPRPLKHPKPPLETSARPRSRPGGQFFGARHVRAIPDLGPARLSRLAGRRQAPGDSRQAAGADRRVARRRQAPQLEIRELLSGTPGSPHLIIFRSGATWIPC